MRHGGSVDQFTSSRRWGSALLAAAAVAVSAIIPVSLLSGASVYAARSTEPLASATGELTAAHQRVLSAGQALEGTPTPQTGPSDEAVQPVLEATHGPDIDWDAIAEQRGPVEPEAVPTARLTLDDPQPVVEPEAGPVPVDPPDLTDAVELEDRRGRFISVHALADGSEVVVASTTPINYRDGSGGWLPIDLSISRGSDGVVRSGGNEYVTSFLPFGDENGGVQLDGHGRAVRFAPAGAQRSEPEVEAEGQSVRYRDVFPGVDIVYVLHGAGITEYVELTRPGTPRVFDFEVFGAEFEPDADGRLVEVAGPSEMDLRVSRPITYLADGREVPTEAHEFSLPPVASIAREAGSQTPDSTIRLGLTEDFVNGLSATDFPVRIDPDFIWGSETLIQAYQYYHPSGGSTGVTYSDALRTGNPYITATSSVRWRSVAYFDYTTQVTLPVNVEAAWLNFNVTCCTTPGPQPIDIYVAHNWSPHTSNNPRTPNMSTKDATGLFTEGSGFNELDTVTIPTSGWSDFIYVPGMTNAYDAYMSDGHAGVAFLFEGNNATGVYTNKKFNMQLVLRTNRRLDSITVGNISQSTQAGTGRTVSWGASGVSPVEPEDTIIYRPEFQVKIDGTWQNTTYCYQSSYGSSSSQSCQFPHDILAAGWSEFRWRTRANDSHNRTYPSGDPDYHTVVPGWRYDSFPQSSPPAPTIHSSSPSGIYSADLTPTLRVNPVSDPDGDQVKYKFFYCVVGATQCEQSNWQTSTQYKIPTGKLRWGDKVGWGVFYGDAEQFLGTANLVVDAVDNDFFIGRTEGTHPELAGGFPAHAADVMGVDPSNGNWRYQSTDLSVPAIALPLGVTRTYNSIDYTTDGPFGPGWSTNVGVRLQSDGSGNLTVYWPDGRREFHGKNADGTYGDAIGWSNSLVKVGSNYQLTESSGTVYTFNSLLKLSSMASESGKTVTFAYPNSSTQVITDQPSGRSLTLTYNGSQRVASASTGGAMWKYYYRTDGRLEKACSPIDNASTGECTVYEYGGSGRLRGVTLPEGNQVRWVTYNGGGGKASSVRDGELNTWTFSYLTATSAQVVDSRPAGNTKTFTFDTDRRLVQTKDAANNTIVYGYDDSSHLASVANEVNKTEQFINDDEGRVELRIDRDGARWRNVYDPEGRLKHAYVPQAAVSGGGYPETTIGSTYVYDADGNKIRETNAEGETQRWFYTNGTESAFGGGTVPAGLLKSYQDPKLQETIYEYDSQGDLRRQTDPTGLVTEFDHDTSGRVTMERSQVDGVWRTTTFEYDHLGRLVKQTDPTVTNTLATPSAESHALVTEWFYDGNGRIYRELRSDLFGNDTAREILHRYDDNDRIEETEDAGGITTLTYDEVGNTRTVEDAEGRITRTTYDHANRPTMVEIVNFEDPTDPGNVRTIVLSETEYTPHGLVYEETNARGYTIRYGYDHRGNMTSATWLNSGSVTSDGSNFVAESNTYDGRGRMTSTVIDNGRRRFDYTFDDADRILSETEDAQVSGHVTADRVTKYQYDLNGNREVTRVTQGQSSDWAAACVASTCEEIRSTYDAANRVLTTTIENGSNDIVTTLVRNEAGEVTQTIDPDQIATTMAYDKLGRLTDTTGATVNVADNGAYTTASPTTTIGYDTFGNATHQRDPAGNVTETMFDALDRLETITHPSYTPPNGGGAIVATEQFDYDAVGNLTSKTDRLGNVTDIAFDSLNRQVRIQQPAPEVGAPRPESFTEYDDAGNVTKTTDPTGAVVEYDYDLLNRRTKTTENVTRNAVVEAHETVWGYDGSGNVVSEQAPNGDTIARLWGRTGELLEEVDAHSKTSTFSYDVGGRLRIATDPLMRTTRHSYDVAGRMLTTAHHDASGVKVLEESTGYDKLGRITSLTNGDGVTTTRDYDDLGRLIEVIQPQGAGLADLVTSYGYDIRGNQTVTVDGESEEWWISYNTWGLVEDRIEPATTEHPAAADRTFTTSYDVAGRPTQEDQPGGVVISRQFDDLGRLISETGGAAGGTKTFEHDEVGRVTQFSSPGGLQTVDYNERGQVVSSTGSMGNSNFDYDAKGRMVERTDVSGSTFYAWWPNDTLKNLTDPVTGNVRAYSWNTATELDSVDYGNGTTRDYTYDPIGRLDTDQLVDGSTTVWSADYGYDSAGRLNSKTITGSGVAGAGSNTYDYDDAGRLIEWSGPGSAVPTTYTWDNNGNRETAGGVTFQYDERNRLTSESDNASTTAYTWDARGTLDQTVETFPAPEPYMTDDFTGTTGTAPNSSRWSASSSQASVTLSAGQLQVALNSSKNAYGQVTALEPQPDTVDQDITVDYEFGSNANNSQATISLTIADSGSEKVWIEISSTSPTATAYKQVGGTTTELGTFNVVETTQTRRLRVRFAGGTMSIRTWDPGSAEPTAWDAQFTASDVDQPGDVVLRVDRLKGSQNVSFDNWSQDDPVGQAPAVTVDYTFDGLGRMTQADGIVYTYDALDRVGNRQGVPFRYSGLEQQPTTDGTTYIARSPGGRPVAAGDGPTSLHLALDRHGDLVATHDGGGLVDTVSFDPFGTELARIGTSELMVGYQGHYTDPTTGLVDMGERWYQASTGTFMSRDTFHGNLETPVSLNRYTYANNSPMDMFDPDGRYAVTVGSNRFLEINGVYNKPAAKTSSRSTWKPSNRFLEINGVYSKPAATPTSTWKPSNSFLEANGVTPPAPAPAPKWTPPAHFLEINTRQSTVSSASIAQAMLVSSLAKEADVDFATMRASVNCVNSDECGGDDLVEALKIVEDTQFGQVIFGTIDVAKQKNWDKADGNWSKDDIKAASDLSTTIEVLAQTGLDAASAAALASVTSSVADRLAQTGDAWEQLDTDLKWYDRGVGKVLKNVGKGVLIAAAGTFLAGFCPVTAGATCAIGAGIVAGAVTSTVLDYGEAKLDGDDYGLGDFAVSSAVGAFGGIGGAMSGMGLAASSGAVGRNGAERQAIGWVGLTWQQGTGAFTARNAAWWVQGKAPAAVVSVGVKSDLGWGD